MAECHWKQNQWSMFIFLLDERLEVHHGVELLRCIAQQRLEITDKPVDVPTKYILRSVKCPQLRRYLSFSGLSSHSSKVVSSLTGQKVAAECSFKGGLRNWIRLKWWARRLSVPLAGRLVYDVLVVVVPQPPRQLIIVHLGFILPQPPSSGNLQSETVRQSDSQTVRQRPVNIYLIRIRQLELPAVSCPGDELLAGFVCEEF